MGDQILNTCRTSTASWYPETHKFSKLPAAEARRYQPTALLLAELRLQVDTMVSRFYQLTRHAGMGGRRQRDSSPQYHSSAGRMT